MAEMNNNFHATLLRIAGNGVLITGSSGSGKTSLALHLLERCNMLSVDCALVSDDQIMFKREGDRVTGNAPTPIAGKLELPHFGIVSITHEPSVEVTHAFSLETNAPRISRVFSMELAGIEIPAYSLPARNELASARIVMHLLNIQLFLGFQA